MMSCNARTSSCCRIWLPDEIMAAGGTLRQALVGTTQSNFDHLRKMYPDVRFVVLGTASAALPPCERLHVAAQCGDPYMLAKATAEIVDLAETACDVAADALDMSDEQVQELFKNIRVEQCIDDHVQNLFKMTSSEQHHADMTLALTSTGGNTSGLLSGQACTRATKHTQASANDNRGAGRIQKAAALAQEYFVPSKDEAQKGGPAPKRQKTDAGSVMFAFNVLEKVPANLQTVRCLLPFLEKKLQVALPAAPEAGPEDLRARLHAHAHQVGRLSSLRAASGWDARAKRILDMPAVLTSLAVGSLLEDVDKAVDRTRGELGKELEERGELSLDFCLEKRIAWERHGFQLDYFRWCWHLLKAREVALTNASGSNDPKEQTEASNHKQLSFICIVERLLAGEDKAVT